MNLGFGRSLATIANLVAYGLLGGFVIGFLATLVGLSIGLVFVLVGFLFAALLALVLRGIWYIESWRVATLFDTDIKYAPLKRSQRYDGWRSIHTLLLQFADGNNWLALLHGFVTTLLGWITLALLSAAGWGIGMIFWPFADWTPEGVDERALVGSFIGIPFDSPWLILIGVLITVVALAAVYALAVAHRAISLPMFAPDREQELKREANEAQQRRGEAIHAASVERVRIERDLYDGIQPRLVSVGMTLGMAKQKVTTDPDRAVALIDEAHTSTKSAITELRQLARGFHPAILEDRGLDAALSALASQSHIPVSLDVRIGRRCAPQVEAAMYFAIAESITNAGKHAKATEVRVTAVERPGGKLWARIEDDGVGGANPLPGGGIDGVANRVRAAGGSYTLTSPAGGPTTVEVSLPCE
ncbi:MAG: histidine kinase [Pseudoclavibacter sp.]